MTNPERQQLVEDELQEKADDIGMDFNMVADHLVEECGVERRPETWNEAAEMWIDFYVNIIDMDSEQEIISQVVQFFDHDE